MFRNFGVGEMLLILLIVMVLFGGKKIPELMHGLGKGLSEFKKASNGGADDPAKEAAAATTTTTTTTAPKV